jgi:branched-chain amino acid transport system permease protein
MNLFLQLLANGVVLGGIYMVIGLSFGLIFNTTRVFHFAHGAVYAVAAYAIYVGVVYLNLSIPVAVIVAAIPTVLVGIGCELLVYRPMRHKGAPPLLVLVASFAILLLFQNLFIILFGGAPLPLSQTLSPSFKLGPINLVELDIWRIVAGLFVAAFILAYLFRTRLGQATRAVVTNPVMATIVGVNTERIYLWAYALGSALLLPAALIDVMAKGASPTLGLVPLLVANIAVFIGGIGVIPAAAVSGMFLGILENVSVFWLPSQWQDTIAFLVLIVFLLVRPMGFFGSIARKV